MQEKIYFYYTNDLHSNFSQWPRVTQYMREVKAKRDQSNDSYWLFDIGDHIDRVHPISEALLGRGNVSLLNDIGYDAVTIGNNEGITFSHQDLFHLYDQATFPVVCANLESLDNKLPEWLRPSLQYITLHGVKISVIGLTAPFNDYYELLGWHITDPYETIEKLIQQVKESSDVIILLSHLGISEDEEIARRFSDIDVIIGGHTHHLLRTGEEVNQTIITAAGKHCYFVGEVILTWDYEENRLIKKEAYTTDISDYAIDVETNQKLHILQEQAEEILDQTIVITEEPIQVNWYEHTEIMQLLTDKIKQETNADIAMFNTGLLLDGFPTGKITLGDIHRVCPHPINPCIVELSGAEVIEVIRASLTKEFMEFQLKGFGFRGKVLGRMIFSGLHVITGIHSNGQEYVEDVLMNEEPLGIEKIYSVVIADSFTFGRLLPEVAKSERKTYILPDFIRDFLAETLKENYR
ncbi:bifunctional UDP-sugar hydrolase/5'-nucleotidase [Paucisalibacillus sp. EB02]|uniref:bifunctional metallophosphatase/5'-nucleotidase n=1 Tax=Paucisalibacillus sp. EB02 TaxID=1347087 RepID=UPI0004ADAF8F|nr:bifunctional UDP-sugar hydrolase/5'-nucleotidase [Paucisalibacillus sp. EB02]